MKDSSGESILVFGKMQKVLFMLCGGGWGISMGIQVSLGILLNEIYNEWGITYIEQSLIPICTMIGVFIGSYFWGILADKYGRAIAFNKVLLFIVLGIGIGVFSPNVWMLAGSYLITGFGIGGSFTVDGNVFLEYCPLEKQYLLTGISVLSAVGASIPAALALAFNSVSDFYRWRFIQGALGVIALLLSLPRFCIKETPTFLISRHKLTQALELISDINPPSTPKDNLRERILSASPKHNAKEKSSKQQLLALTRKPVVKYTVLYIFIWFGTAFTFNGLANFLPVILTRSGFGQTNTDLYTMMLYQQLAGIPGVILATFMVKSWFGRKKTLALSLYMGFGLIFCFLTSNYWALLFLSLLYFFFENMFYAVMFCISPETFPPEVRNTAIGIFGSANTVASIIAPLVAGIILEHTSDNLVFTIAFSSSILLAAICSTWSVETKNFDPESFGKLDFS